MGAKDIKRQRPNVVAIKNGAEKPVTTGSQTLVDAVSECMNTGSNCDTTHMCVGSTVVQTYLLRFVLGAQLKFRINTSS